MYNDEFINTHAANVQLLALFNTLTGSASQRLQQLHEQFEATVAYDTCDSTAFPVCVYVKNNTNVAWYDFELAEGYRS